MAVSINQKVLSVIDVQRDFVKNYDYSVQIDKIRSLVDIFKTKLWPIILVEYKGFGCTIPKIYNKVRKYPNTLVVEKDSNDGSLEILRCINEKEFVLCGLYSDYCVTETAKGLLIEGKNVEIINDCCITYEYGNYNNKFRWLNDTVTDSQKTRLRFYKSAEEMSL